MTKQNVHSRTEASKRPRGRPRSKDADEKLQNILTKAAELFASQGFNKTSFASVATAVGLTLPGLTYYYPRKIDLLKAVLNDRDAEMFDKGAPPAGQDIFDVMIALMQRDTGRGAELTKLFAVLSSEAMSADHPAHDWFQSRGEKILAAVSDQLAALQRTGVVKPHIDCTAEAGSLLAMMQGLQLWWLQFPDKVDPNAAFETFISTTKVRLLA